MDRAQLEQDINAAWEARDTINAETTGAVRDRSWQRSACLIVVTRVAEPMGDHQWHVNQWLEKAVLPSFRLNDMAVIPSGTSYPGSGEAVWWDKVPSKFAGWDEARFRSAGFRAVPGCVVRHSAHIGAGAVLMPSFVNLGAYVDSGTMVDTWATVGSCAQIGKNVHLSGGAGIGGVLEPLQAGPVIIEDNCFIGARSKLSKAWLWNRAQFCRWVCSLAPQPRSSIVKLVKFTWAVFLPIRLWCLAVCPGNRLLMARLAIFVLCRDHQAGG